WRVDQPRFLLGLRLAEPQALGQSRVRVFRPLVGAALAVAAVTTRQRLADRVLEVGVTLEAEFLAELDDARLAYLQCVRELLRGVVTQEVRLIQDVIRDAAFYRRHLVPFSADLEQR